MINRTKKILILSVILGIGFLVLPYTSNAVGEGVMQGVAISVVNSAIANIANFFLMFAASVVFWTGILLSISVRITTNIGALYTSITGIQSVWVTIRDLSSIFIIFSLLYYSIRTILGIGGNSMNQLIVNIFMAGILINFSLFFVRIAVDASNLVSLQFYNAITPSSSAPLTDFTNLSFVASAENVVKDANGLSNVFMQSLKLPKIYQNTGILKSSDVTASIGFAAIGGIIMMMIAALSFLAASLAFIIRTAILLGIMALSPLFFVGMIFPDIKRRVSDKMGNYLYNQCVFMPVYFFLLYVSLRIISDDGFMKIFNQNAVSGTGSAFGAISISTIIQYTIAIVFINLPLLAAIELGGQGMKWAPQAKDIGKLLGGFAGRNTLGRISRWAGESFDKNAASGKVFGSEGLYKVGAPLLRLTRVSQGIRGGLKAGEESKYGGSANLGGVKKEDKDRARTLAGVERSGIQMANIQNVIGKKANPTPEQEEEFTKTIGKMNKKELEETKFDTLVNEKFVGKLSSKQFETLTDGDSLTEDQKEKLKTARKDTLNKDLTLPIAKDLMKGLSGKELAKLKPETLKNVNLMNNLSPAHLKEMEDTLDRETKRIIARHIHDLPADNEHKAYGYMQDARNFDRWSR